MIESADLSQVVEALTRIEGWLRFENSPRLREMLNKELDASRKKVAYENSDGVRSLREVATASGIPSGTLQGWWNRWLSLGIATESPLRRGRMRRLCSLRDLGMDTAKLSDEV